MSVSDAPSGGPRHVVAVGPSREDAAAQFGLDHADMFLTSYAELSAEVDLNRVASVDLAAGDGLYAALDEICRKLDGHPGFTLRIEYEAGSGPALAEVLERNRLVIVEVQNREGTLLLVLDSVSHATAPRTRTILSAIDAAKSSTLPAEEVPAVRPTGESVIPQPAEGAVGPALATSPVPNPAGRKRPRPRLLGHLQRAERWRNGRRRRAAVLLALAAGAVALLALGMLSASWTPVILILLVALVLLVLGGIGALLMTVLLLSRQVHAQTGRIERMLLRSRTLMQQRTTAIERQVGEISRQQKRLPFMLDYLEAMAASSSASAVRITDQLEAAETRAADLHLYTQRQIEAVLTLHRLVDLDDRVPPMGGWTASADFDVLMLQQLLTDRPSTVVECGSGTATLLLALAVKQHGLSTRVVALEHLEMNKTQTERALEQHGVSDVAEVRLAPLSLSSVSSMQTWPFAAEAVADLEDIGLLVVTGPPGTPAGRRSFPSVPPLRDRLSANCAIVFDGLSAQADPEMVESWKALLPDFDYTQLDAFDSHIGVFKR